MDKKSGVKLVFTTGTPEELIDLSSRIHKISNAEVVGATTGAFIFRSKVFETGNITYPLNLENIGLVKTVFSQGDSVKAGREISEYVRNLDVDLSKCILLLLSDGTNTDGETLIEIISESCPEIAIAGGMASAPNPNLQTAVCYNDTLITEGAVGILLCADNLKIFQSYLFDWEEIGDYHIVTEAEKSRVFKIDGIPASRFYGKFLGKEVEESLPDIGINYPLVYHKGGLKVARACIRKFSDGSLGFSGHIPRGTKVRFSTGVLRGFTPKKEEIRKLKEVARKSSEIFIFSCIARKNFLRELAELELMLFMNVLNVGFFTHGEFFKKPNEEGLVLNETLTVAGIATKEENNKVPFIDENLLYPYKRSEIFKTYSPVFHLLKRTGDELEVIESGLSHTKSCIIILEREPGCKWFCPFVSENAKEVLGVDHTAIKAMNIDANFVLEKLIYYEDKEIVRNAINKVLELGESEVDFRMVVDGKIKWVRGFVRFFKQENKDILIHVFQDITSDKKVEFLANYDPLTELYNRRILRKLEQELKVSNRWNALLFLDIDKFKEINDTYGHDVGDKVLKFVADSIRKSIRKTDVAVRYAGDEFVVFLTDIGSSRKEALEKAISVARRILSRVSDYKQTEINRPVSLSIGIKVFKDIEKLEEIISNADRIMYMAKEKGGNRYETA